MKLKFEHWVTLNSSISNYPGQYWNDIYYQTLNLNCLFDQAHNVSGEMKTLCLKIHKEKHDGCVNERKKKRLWDGITVMAKKRTASFENICALLKITRRGDKMQAFFWEDTWVRVHYTEAGVVTLSTLTWGGTSESSRQGHSKEVQRKTKKKEDW